MTQRLFTFSSIIFASLYFYGCSSGPYYKKIEVPLTTAYKENKDWKLASPQDSMSRGNWWETYNDPILNQLISRVNINNQSILSAEAQYKQALALVQSAQAALLPGVQGVASHNSNHASGSTAQTNTISVTASWIPDFWGGVRRSVEASKASAQSSQALVESASLAARSTLAQAYFQLRISDLQKRIYDETIVAYKKALQITRNQVKAGIVTELDVSQAETLLSSTEALSIDIDVSRSQLEHAIAVLIGEMPANFSIARDTSTLGEARFVEQSRIYQLIANLPTIPLGIPAQLLERRPDIASAERQMEAANARIGVAQAAFFPVPVLSAGAGYQGSSLSNLLNANNFVWSLGPSLAQSIFDGGTRLAATRQAMAAYEQSVATYRQTVLTAFQNVEDNLIAISLLNEEIKKQQRAVQFARRAVDISMNQYKAGVVSYLTVVTAQASLLTNERTLVTLYNREIASHVNLITALGGYWDVNLLNSVGDSSKSKP